MLKIFQVVSFLTFSPVCTGIYLSFYLFKLQNSYEKNFTFLGKNIEYLTSIQIHKFWQKINIQIFFPKKRTIRSFSNKIQSAGSWCSTSHHVLLSLLLLSTAFHWDGAINWNVTSIRLKCSVGSLLLFLSNTSLLSIDFINIHCKE